MVQGLSLAMALAIFFICFVGFLAFVCPIWALARSHAKVKSSLSAGRYKEWEDWMTSHDCRDEAALDELSKAGQAYVLVAREMPFSKLYVDITTWKTRRPKVSRRMFLDELAMRYNMSEPTVKRRVMECEKMIGAGIRPM